MKKKILVGISLMALGFGLVGCDDKKAQGGFMHNLGDCKVVFQKCMADQSQGLSQKEKTISCEKARGLCAALNIKLCMQKCVEQSGPNSASTESCKRNCENRSYY